MTALIACNVYQANDVVPYPNGGRLSFSPVHNLIIADRAISNQWRIVTYLPDGSNMVELEVTHPDLPAGAHRGNPEWSPDGNWFLFQAATYVAHLGGFPGYSTPGLGVANDVYIASYPGLAVTRLTDIVTGAAGVLHPHFNHDGTKVWWSRKWSGREGRWCLETADISFPGGAPTLSNRMLRLPLGDGLYETHEFSPAGTQVLFTHSAAGTSTQPGLNCYRASSSDFFTGLVALEGDNDPDDYWQEHGKFSRPAGAWIFYMGSRGSPYDPWTDLQSDVWRISNQSPPVGLGTRVTDTINNANGTFQIDVAHPVCGDMDFIDGEQLLLYVFDGGPTGPEYRGETTRPGKIVRITCAP